MLSAIAIGAGYVVLVAAVGPWGLVAAAAHIAVMLGAVRRGGD